MICLICVYLCSSVVQKYLSLCALWLNPLSVERPVNSLYLVKHRVDRAFRSDELRQRDLRKSVFDDLVQADYNGPDAAIAIVDTRIEHTGVAFAVLRQHILIKHVDDLAKPNISRRSRQKIAALGAAR